ncbi:hypothetical protein QNH28_25975 [Paenibacillus sp. G2S3]|uniref:hypothetical protein n=1 Tax=Paenibacillus sp. G2S3 TaxID=3047872 RepID=UPI0024C15E50|nr:hypothetical protein [Paenibacillus sp. G2S3]WHY18823.1 hypothetical protein QNH28_25975 [Paenibacillus sp. G2S3]
MTKRVSILADLNREGVPETESTLMRRLMPKFTSESAPEVLSQVVTGMSREARAPRYRV